MLPAIGKRAFWTFIISFAYVLAMRARQKLSLESLRVFEAIARLGGFTRAADELGLSQSAVSLRMRNLQDELDVPVFERTRPKTVLTPAGERLADQLSRAFEIISAATADVRAPDAPLRLSVNPTFGSRWLAPRLRELRDSANMPRIIVDVSTQLRSIPEVADVAIRTGKSPWPDLACTLLMPVERTPMMDLKLAAKLGYPPKVAALRDLPLLYSEDWPRWFDAAGLKFSDWEDTGEVYPSQDLLAQAVMAGAGVGLLSPRLFESLIERGDLVAPFDIVLSGPESHYAVYDPDRSHPLSGDLVHRLALGLSSGSS